MGVLSGQKGPGFYPILLTAAVSESSESSWGQEKATLPSSAFVLSSALLPGRKANPFALSRPFLWEILSLFILVLTPILHGCLCFGSAV